jgi:opacity protein-like surface antigen
VREAVRKANRASNRRVIPRKFPKGTLAIAFALVLGCLPARAQKNEIGVIVGGYVPIGTTLDVTPGVALEGSFAHRLFSVPLASLYAELPVAGGFRIGGSKTLGQTFSPGNYSALFITPGVKLKLAPEFPFSPYLVAGVGYARYHTSGVLGAGTGTSENKVVVDVGGGMDMKIAPFVSLRGEVRDFHSTSPGLLSIIGVSDHNIVAGGGLVLRF